MIPKLCWYCTMPVIVEWIALGRAFHCLERCASPCTRANSRAHIACITRVPDGRAARSSLQKHCKSASNPRSSTMISVLGSRSSDVEQFARSSRMTLLLHRGEFNHLNRRRSSRYALEERLYTDLCSLRGRKSLPPLYTNASAQLVEPISRSQEIRIKTRFRCTWFGLPVVLPARERRQRHQNGFGTPA